MAKYKQQPLSVFERQNYGGEAFAPDYPGSGSDDVSLKADYPQPEETQAKPSRRKKKKVAAKPAEPDMIEPTERRKLTTSEKIASNAAPKGDLRSSLGGKKVGEVGDTEGQRAAQGLGENLIDTGKISAPKQRTNPKSGQRSDIVPPPAYEGMQKGEQFDHNMRLMHEVGGLALGTINPESGLVGIEEGIGENALPKMGKNLPKMGNDLGSEAVTEVKALSPPPKLQASSSRQSLLNDPSAVDSQARGIPDAGIGDFIGARLGKMAKRYGIDIGESAPVVERQTFEPLSKMRPPSSENSVPLQSYQENLAESPGWSPYDASSAKTKVSEPMPSAQMQPSTPGTQPSGEYNFDELRAKLAQNETPPSSGLEQSQQASQSQQSGPKLNDMYANLDPEVRAEIARLQQGAKKSFTTVEPFSPQQADSSAGQMLPPAQGNQMLSDVAPNDATQNIDPQILNQLRSDLSARAYPQSNPLPPVQQAQAPLPMSEPLVDYNQMIDSALQRHTDVNNAAYGRPAEYQLGPGFDHQIDSALARNNAMNQSNYALPEASDTQLQNMPVSDVAPFTKPSSQLDSFQLAVMPPAPIQGDFGPQLSRAQLPQMSTQQMYDYLGAPPDPMSQSMGLPPLQRGSYTPGFAHADAMGPGLDAQTQMTGQAAIPTNPGTPSGTLPPMQPPGMLGPQDLHADKFNMLGDQRIRDAIILALGGGAAAGVGYGAARVATAGTKGQKPPR